MFGIFGGVAICYLLFVYIYIYICMKLNLILWLVFVTIRARQFRLLFFNLRVRGQINVESEISPSVRNISVHLDRAKQESLRYTEPIIS